MKLLFKRNQTAGQVGKVKFQLWGKVELDEEESEIVKRYKFDDAILIEAVQPTLIRNTALIAGGVWVVLFGVLVSGMGGTGESCIHQLINFSWIVRHRQRE